MACKFMGLFAFTILLCSVVRSEAGCHQKSRRVLVCENVTIGDIDLPDDVDKVILERFDISALKAGAFNDSQWTRLKALTINGIFHGNLSGFVFQGLSNLQNLSIHNSRLVYLSKDAFQGLDNVTSLDLSDAKRVSFVSLMTSLEVEVFPLLKTVILQYLNYPRTIKMEETFFRGLTSNGTRRIRYVDLSYTIIDFLNYYYISKFNMCNSVHTIILRGSTIWNVVGYMTDTPCSSLRVIDISDVVYMPIIKFNITPVTTDFTCFAMTWYWKVQQYYMTNFLNKSLAPDMSVSNYSLNMSACPIEIEGLYFSRNTLCWANVTVTLHPVTARSVRTLEFADNVLEYMSPGFLAPSYNISHLDFNNNRLYVMQRGYPNDFEVLFHNQFVLQTLKLCGNRLSNLPWGFLKNKTHLLTFDISNNQIKDITFELHNLRSIGFINVSYNWIEYLASSSRDEIDSLYEITEGKTNNFTIDLSNNPFKCDCHDDSIDFIRWLVNRQNTVLAAGTYECRLDEHVIDIFNDGLYHIHVICRWKLIKQCLYITCPILLILLLIVAGLFCRRHRKRKHERQTQENYDIVVDLLRRNVFPMASVMFLSHCSEDESLVLNQILPTIQSTMRGLVGTDRVLVSRGDISFRPGFAICDELIRCIGDAAVIVLVISRNFCAKDWCQQELREAYDQHKPIVLIMLGNVERRLMGRVLWKLFSRYTHARWVPGTDGNVANGHLEPECSHFCRSVLALAGPMIRNQSQSADMSSETQGILSNAEDIARESIN